MFQNAYLKYEFRQQQIDSNKNSNKYASEL